MGQAFCCHPPRQDTLHESEHEQLNASFSLCIRTEEGTYSALSKGAVGIWLRPHHTTSMFNLIHVRYFEFTLQHCRLLWQNG